MLLVYGALPRFGLPTSQPTPPTFARVEAHWKAIPEISKHIAKHQVQAAARARQGRAISDKHSIPIGVHILVCRLDKDCWECSCSALDIDEEDFTVVLPPPPVPKTFCSTVMKRYLGSSAGKLFTSSGLQLDSTSLQKGSERANTLLPSHNHPFTIATPISAVLTNNEALVNTVLFSAASINDLDDFGMFLGKIKLASITDELHLATSRIIEFNSLVERGVFTVADKFWAHEKQVFGSQFADVIKNEGEESSHKEGRPVIQAYNDKKHGMLTNVPIIHVRCILYFFAS